MLYDGAVDLYQTVNFRLVKNISNGESIKYGDVYITFSGIGTIDKNTMLVYLNEAKPGIYGCINNTNHKGVIGFVKTFDHDMMIKVEFSANQMQSADITNNAIFEEIYSKVNDIFDIFDSNTNKDATFEDSYNKLSTFDVNFKYNIDGSLNNTKLHVAISSSNVLSKYCLVNLCYAIKDELNSKRTIYDIKQNKHVDSCLVTRSFKDITDNKHERIGLLNYSIYSSSTDEFEIIFNSAKILEEIFKNLITCSTFFIV